MATTDDRTLTQRDLNRALLARQLLLERAKTPIPKALDRIGGIQAQYAPSMYIGLWSRLAGFEREQLTRALERGSVVQGTLMRGDDPSRLEGGLLAVRSRHPQGPARVAAARPREGDRPRELIADARKVRRAMRGKALQARRARGGARQAVRPERPGARSRARSTVGNVGAPARRHLRAGRGLGRPRERDRAAQGVELLVRRYLQGFGPASREGHRGLGRAQRRDDPAGARPAVACGASATNWARSSSISPAPRCPTPRLPPPPLPPGLGRDAARPRAAHRNPSRALPGSHLQRQEPPIREHVPRRRAGRGNVAVRAGPHRARAVRSPPEADPCRVERGGRAASRVPCVDALAVSELLEDVREQLERVDARARAPASSRPAGCRPGAPR